MGECCGTCTYCFHDPEEFMTVCRNNESEYYGNLRFYNESCDKYEVKKERHKKFLEEIEDGCKECDVQDRGVEENS